MADDATDGVPKPGEVVAGKYVVEEVLGTGGMGTVLGARHLQLGQAVALKCLHQRALAMPEAAARILREARAAAALQSEHVARVVDVGTFASGAPYLAMERLVGSDLRDLCGDGPLPIAGAVLYVLQDVPAHREAARILRDKGHSPQN